MAHYIDGFVFPIQREHLAEYKALVEPIAEIWRAHGALAYQEYIGDDMALPGTKPFADAVAATEEEAIIFGWVVFESRQARDQINEAISSDPKMQQLMAESDSGFDPARMAYGGFAPFVVND